MNKVRVLLADDHAILREGLTLLVNAQADMCVAGQAGSGREALHVLQETTVDVAVLDVSMPELGGAQTAEQIRQHFPDVRILALTRHTDQGYLRRLLQAGASGYVLKRTASDALIQAIRIVAGGGTYIDPTLAAGLVELTLGARAAAGSTVRETRLTGRETEVLRLIAWGHSNKEIAARLEISVKTAESYKAAAIEKLHLRTRSDILRYASSQGWLGSDSAPE